jgi:hypothetical protein
MSGRFQASQRQRPVSTDYARPEETKSVYRASAPSPSTVEPYRPRKDTQRKEKDPNLAALDELRALLELSKQLSFGTSEPEPQIPPKKSDSRILTTQEQLAQEDARVQEQNRNSEPNLQRRSADLLSGSRNKDLSTSNESVRLQRSAFDHAKSLEALTREGMLQQQMRSSNITTPTATGASGDY